MSYAEQTAEEGSIVIDMSNHGGDWTVSEAQAAWNLGARTVMPGSGPGWYGLKTYQQASTGFKNGFALEAYGYYEFGGNIEVFAHESRAALKDLDRYVGRFWADFEDTSAAYSVGQRIDFINRALEAYDRVWKDQCRVEFYGARWYHQGYLGNADNWKDRQLMNAYYDGDKDIDGLPFGGFTRDSVAIEQYQGTTSFGGQSVDIGYLYKLPSGKAHPKMNEDAVIATFGNREEFDQLAKGQITREELLSNCQFRIGKIITMQPNNPPFYDAFLSHTMAHPGATKIAAHLHTPGGVIEE